MMSKVMRLKSIPAVIAACCIAGCSGEGVEGDAAQGELQAKAAMQLAGSRDQFAFALKNEMAKAQPGVNSCFSPLSIQLCLSMLLNGAAGSSQEDLKKTLSLGDQQLATVNLANRHLLEALSGKEFTVANSIWMHGEVQPKPAFESVMTSDYKGEFFAVAEFDKAAVDQVNQWTADRTKGRITKLFDSFFPLTRVVLVNALTFDGKWTQPFNKERTKEADFHLSPGKVVQVPTMHQTEDLDYAELEGVKTLRLDYVGKQFAMVFLLPPAEQKAADFFAKLTPAQLKSYMSKLHATNVQVAIPKFELRSKYDLKPILSPLGMAPLFASGDFSGISDAVKDAKIAQVVHQTYIKVHEEGTEAAAATGVTVAVKSLPAEPPSFRADRPFVYAIVHRPTGAIVFFGLVSDPRG